MSIHCFVVVNVHLSFTSRTSRISRPSISTPTFWLRDQIWDRIQKNPECVDVMLCNQPGLRSRWCLPPMCSVYCSSLSAFSRELRSPTIQALYISNQSLVQEWLLNQHEICWKLTCRLLKRWTTYDLTAWKRCRKRKTHAFSWMKNKQHLIKINHSKTTN